MTGAKIIDTTRKPTPAKLRAPAQRVPTDPPMNADRTCLFSDCDHALTKIAVANEDPFCSTVCCRRYYGVER